MKPLGKRQSLQQKNINNVYKMGAGWEENQHTPARSSQTASLDRWLALAGSTVEKPAAIYES